MMNHQNVNPRFLEVAVRYAISMNAQTVNQFCSHLKFFESVYNSEKDTQEVIYDETFKNVHKKPKKKNYIRRFINLIFFFFFFFKLN
jgi:hypothetical protein